MRDFVNKSVKELTVYGAIRISQSPVSAHCFSAVCVAQSLVFMECFVDQCLFVFFRPLYYLSSPRWLRLMPMKIQVLDRNRQRIVVVYMGSQLSALDRWISNSNMDINKQLETMQKFASTTKDNNRTLSKKN